MLFMYYLRMFIVSWLFFILSGDETQNLCYNSPNWNYMIVLPASFNITLVSIVVDLICASHTYKPRSSSVVFNICNSYCFSCSWLVVLNLSLPLKTGLIVESWDMIKFLRSHLRVGLFSYWHDSTAVPGIVIYCIFISLMVPWRPSLIIRKKYKIKCMYKQWNSTIQILRLTEMPKSLTNHTEKQNQWSANIKMIKTGVVVI